jgi:hypothetical protein
MKISSKAELEPVLRAMHEQAEALLACEKQVLIEVSEFKPKRSLDQNNYYREYLKQLAFFLEKAGVKKEYSVLGYKVERLFTSDDIHNDIHKPMFNIETTKKMSIQEFCDFIHRVQAYWSDRTGGGFMMSELPEQYLIRKGYDLEYNLR